MRQLVASRSTAVPGSRHTQQGMLARPADTLAERRVPTTGRYRYAWSLALNLTMGCRQKLDVKNARHRSCDAMAACARAVSLILPVSSLRDSGGGGGGGFLFFCAAAVLLFRRAPPPARLQHFVTR
jgi:hypothetical protein